MNIYKIVNEPSVLSSEYDLLNYLSQYVLTKSGELTEKFHTEYLIKKSKLINIRDRLDGVKENFVSISKQFAKERIISRILFSIDTLRKEGVLTKQKKTKILKLLNGINKKRFSDLRSIEEDLSIYKIEN